MKLESSNKNRRPAAQESYPQSALLDGMAAVAKHVPKVYPGLGLAIDKLPDQGIILDALAIAYAQRSGARIDTIEAWEERLRNRAPVTNETWINVSESLAHASESPRTAYASEVLPRVQA